MPQKGEYEPDDISTAEGDVAQEDGACEDQHVADLDDGSKRFLSMFATIRSKVDDLARSQSDIQRFELSIDGERKRLVKQVETAKLALRNARIQIGAELAKVDAAGFEKVLQIVKDANAS